MTDLGTLGGTFSRANAINASGEVVGVAGRADGTTQGAFLYSHGSMADIGTLGRRTPTPRRSASTPRA